MTDFTLKEIQSQPEVWKQVLDLCEKKEHTNIKEWMANGHSVLTGSGSSFYLCLTAASVFTHLTHRRAMAISASEICTFPDTFFADTGKYSLLAVSRNGKSVETVDAARWFNNSHPKKTIAISTVASSPLLEICEPGLLLTPAAESSRYMTRSFTAPLLGILYLLASSTGNSELQSELNKLPEIGTRVLEQAACLVKTLAEQKEFDNYVALGQGPFYGLAAEAMLKVKEMVRAPAHAYPSLEVMHGPNHQLSRKTMVTLLHAESAKNYELALLKRLQPSGACTFVICEKASPELRKTTEFVFELCSGVSEFARLILTMPVMQLYAYYRARATGHELE